VPILKPHANILVSDHTQIVVIDMQEPFLRNLHERERVLRNVCTLIQGANVLRVPVVTTTQYAEKMGDLTPEVKAIAPYRPFDKLTFSCYADFRFSSEIDKANRRQVVLCGVESHICVSQTAHDLLAADYHVHVVTDATSSRSETNWRLGLEKMRLGGVIPTSVETVLYELLRQAGTPEFREILTLIK